MLSWLNDCWYFPVGFQYFVRHFSSPDTATGHVGYFVRLFLCGLMFGQLLFNEVIWPRYLAHWTVLPGRVRRSTSYTKINDHATFVCCLFCVTKTMVSMTVGLKLCIRIVSCLICRLYFQLLVVPHSTHERLDIEKITIRYDTIRDAILTCARKPTWVSLIYRTETTTKRCKTEKLKSKNGYAQK